MIPAYPDGNSFEDCVVTLQPHREKVLRTIWYLYNHVWKWFFRIREMLQNQ